MADGNTHESDGVTQAGRLLRPKSNVQRESSTTSFKDLLRNFSRGEDVHPDHSKIPEATVEVSSRQSDSAIVKVRATHCKVSGYDYSRSQGFLSSW